MADEPEVQVGTEAPAETPPEAVAEAPPAPSAVAALEAGWRQAEAEAAEPDREDDEPDDEEDEAEPATPLTPADRKKLRDLVAEDPEYARELADIQDQTRADAVATAAAAERARLEGERRQQYQQEIAGARAAELQYRVQEDAWLDEVGAVDPIRRQDEWEIRKVRREAEDTAWAAWDGQQRYEAQHSQQLERVRTTEQQTVMDALGFAARKVLPRELLDTLGARAYSKEMGPGMAAYLADAFAEAIEHGKKLGRAETSSERQRDRRRVASEVGLAEPRPDISIVTPSTAPALTLAEVDSWPLEKRLEAQQKDPFFYDKLVSTSRRAARRR